MKWSIYPTISATLLMRSLLEIWRFYAFFMAIHAFTPPPVRSTVATVERTTSRAEKQKTKNATHRLEQPQNPWDEKGKFAFLGRFVK